MMPNCAGLFGQPGDASGVDDMYGARIKFNSEAGVVGVGTSGNVIRLSTLKRLCLFAAREEFCVPKVPRHQPLPIAGLTSS